MAISSCTGITGINGRELLQHGTSDFPFACYFDDLRKLPTPLHWHDELEAALVISGETRLRIGEREYLLQAGSGYFANSGVLHAAEVSGSDNCFFHSIVFSPRLLGSMESVYWHKYIQPFITDFSMEGICLYPETPWQAQALSSIEAAWISCRDEPFGFEFEIRNSLSRLMEAMLTYRNSQTQRVSPKSIRDAQRIKQMLSYIHAHYGEAMSLADIAEAAAVSESECLRCFRGSVGTAPIQYLKRYRLQRAAELLRTTDFKIADIANQCGFDDTSYFSREFARFSGAKPSDFRKSDTSLRP